MMKTCPHCEKEVSFESEKDFKEHARKCFFELNGKKLKEKSQDLTDVREILDERRDIFMRFYRSSRGVNVSAFLNENVDMLNSFQKGAVDFIVNNAANASMNAETAVTKRVIDLGYEKSDVDKVKLYLRDKAPLLIHVNLVSNLKHFILDDHYRNCFEISGHNPTRVHVENKLFNNKYDRALPFERVKYGALNILNDPIGISVCYGYGDSYFILKNVRMRTTFTSMDTFSNIQNIASCEHYLHVLNEFTNEELRAVLEVAIGKAPFLRSSNVQLGTYKEVQYHGPVNFFRDIECLVVNPVHRTNTELIEEI